MRLSTRTIQIRLLMAAIGAAFLVSDAVAQSTEPLSKGEPIAASGAQVSKRADTESVSDYVLRLFKSDPSIVPAAAAAMLKEKPSVWSELIGLTRGTVDVRTSVGRGLSRAAEANPVAIARQVSALAIADQDSVALMITVARDVNSAILSQIVGEGLALAASTLSDNGDLLRVASIQSLATATDSPVPLVEAFLDDMRKTAAAREDVVIVSSDSTNFTADDVSESATRQSGFAPVAEETRVDGVTQTAGVSAPSGGTNVAVGSVSVVRDTSPVLP